MSFKLDIKNADGSTYWTENFPEKKDAESWIKEEKTRPYWVKEFTYKIEKEAVSSIDSAEFIEKILKKKEDAKKAIKKIDLSVDISKDDLKKIVKALIELLD